MMLKYWSHICIIKCHLNLNSEHQSRTQRSEGKKETNDRQFICYRCICSDCAIFVYCALCIAVDKCQTSARFITAFIVNETAPVCLSSGRR